MKIIHIDALRAPGGIFVSLLEIFLRSWVSIILVLGIYTYAVAQSVPPLLKLTVMLLVTGTLLCHHCLAKFHIADRVWDRLGKLVVLLGAFAVVGWVLFFDTVQNSDFGVYYKCGTAISSDTLQWLENCQSKYLHENLIYWSRSLLYTSLFSWVGGDSYFELKLFNAALHIVTSIVWYFGVRSFYGAKVATISSLCVLFYPEWWFTSTIATTDNAAVLFIVSFLCLLPRLLVNPRSFLLLCGIALITFSANLLRTLGPILILVFFLWALYHAVIRKSFIYAGCFLGFVVIYGAIGYGLSLVTPPGIADPLQFLKALSSIDFSSSQDFGNNYPWGEHFWFSIPPEARASAALEKLYLEVVYGFSEWPGYLYQKAASLFNGSGYYGLSSFPFPGFNPDTVYTVKESTVYFDSGFFPWLASLMAVYLLVSLWVVLTTTLNGPGFVAVIWFAMFSLVVLGVGESQPRYSILVAPVLALFMGLSFFERSRVTSAYDNRRSMALKVLSGCALIFVIFLAVLALLNIAKHVRPGPSLKALALAPAREGSKDCDSNKYILEKNYKRVRLSTPPGVKCAGMRIPLSADTKVISFFMSEGRFPFLWESPVVSTFKYRVEIDGQQLLETSLNQRSVLWHRLVLPESVVHDGRVVDIYVERDSAIDAAIIDVGLFTEGK
ncbi:ArnT family glycosyltransferase [Pseudomonas sp. RT4P38]